MNTRIFDTSDENVYRRCDFTCVYCGFDGRVFENWMQLSIDHVLPRNSGGGNSETNKVVACRSCNSITSRMKFPPDTPRKIVFDRKKQRIKNRRDEFRAYWKILVSGDEREED